MAEKFTTTTKDIGLLWQLHEDGQLVLAPEFQRNSVWPRAARAFLIDTILTGYPIPVLYFQRQVSAQTNRVQYAVVDGQQRLSTVFAFMSNRFSLTESSPSSPWHRKRWKDLSDTDRQAILSYDFTVQEISGFNAERVREIFRRMNRYVVALNPQEYRHSDEPGAFKTLVEQVGDWPFWTTHRVITPGAAKRMKNDELAAELLILLNEGPQDKKTSVDLYYGAFKDEFPEGHSLEMRLKSHITFIENALPNLGVLPFRKPAGLYALIGALDEISIDEAAVLPSPAEAGERLRRFASDLKLEGDEQPKRAREYVIAASRQTDNIQPRERRVSILKNVLLGS
ncbi:DUF262 domain-containing protein [Georgenia sp. 311]|uniref:DUF262 domain-containing protein n=1 Tax=Georgenia sp. 311 TaxID=2585134 RepID=UPI0011120F1D|nr:DUF262 domain-containing protein [Georgenia sp. 311]TNC16599.1 DUF262 domain-containing protein [Georgenia sp. 311]